MRCRWLEKRYPGGRLAGDDPEAIEHLKECQDCKQEKAEWEQLDNLLGQMPDFDPPPELLRMVMTEIERQPVEKPFSFRMRLSDWWEETAAFLERVLSSEYWSPLINLTASFAAVLLFFTESSRFSVINPLLHLARSGDGQGILSQAVNNPSFQDLMWSIKVGASGIYYSFLTYMLK